MINQPVKTRYFLLLISGRDQGFHSKQWVELMIVYIERSLNCLENGLPLFKNAGDSAGLNLLDKKTFGCGTITLYCMPSKK